MLSGGERNRLLLARLFARPANLVVLDEPTNDLDIESLELLEQKLQEYTGTLLLVSHDRRFLDNVVTQTLAAEGDGVWREIRRRLQRLAAKAAAGRAAAPRAADAGAPGTRRRRWPKRRRTGRAPNSATRSNASWPPCRGKSRPWSRSRRSSRHAWGARTIIARDPQRLREDRRRLEELESLLSVKFSRWETLEQLASGFT